MKPRVLACPWRIATVAVKRFRVGMLLATAQKENAMAAKAARQPIKASTSPTLVRHMTMSVKRHLLDNGAEPSVMNDR